MAKPPTNQEHEAVRTLRENVKALRGDTSYRELAKAAAAPTTVGRSINGLVKGDSRTRVDLVAAAADGLDVEVWQLFVPSIAELNREEREQLRKLVRVFIKNGDAMRRILNASVDLHTPVVEKESRQKTR